MCVCSTTALRALPSPPCDLTHRAALPCPLAASAAWRLSRRAPPQWQLAASRGLRTRQRGSRAHSDRRECACTAWRPRALTRAPPRQTCRRCVRSQRGADVNALGNNGDAPLHCACRHGIEAIARLLVEVRPLSSGWRSTTTSRGVRSLEISARRQRRGAKQRRRSSAALLGSTKFVSARLSGRQLVRGREQPWLHGAESAHISVLPVPGGRAHRRLAQRREASVL